MEFLLTRGVFMIQQDTVRLLRECDAGAKMGVSSIDDVMEYVKDSEFRRILMEGKQDHEKLTEDIRQLLNRYGDDGKEPAAIAKGMSWIKTNVKLAVNESDETVADLMVDGCDMGVKSLSKYLNKYKAADEDSKDAAKRLIKLEEQMAKDIRAYR